MTSSSDSPSQRVMDQRIRNRLIEALELAASFEEQLDYEKRVPIANVPGEVIVQWEDWFLGPDRIDQYGPPVFTAEERAAFVEYHLTWDAVCDALPQELPPLIELQASEPWRRMREAARRALAVLMQRGKSSEDSEETSEG